MLFAQWYVHINERRIYSVVIITSDFEIENHSFEYR